MLRLARKLTCITLIYLTLAIPGWAAGPGSIFGWGAPVTCPVGKLTEIAAGGWHGLGLRPD